MRQVIQHKNGACSFVYEASEGEKFDQYMEPFKNNIHAPLRIVNVFEPTVHSEASVKKIHDACTKKERTKERMEAIEAIASKPNATPAELMRAINMLKELKTA